MALTHVKGGRDALIAATLRVLDREGVDGVTLRAVGREAHVSAPAVYWHFEDKEALVGVVVREIAAQFVRRVRTAVAAAPAESRMDAVGDAFVAFVVEHPHRFQLLFRRPPRGALKPLHRAPPANSSFGVLVEVVEQAMGAGTLRRDDAVSVALTVAALAQGLVLLLERGRFADRAEFAAFARLSFGRLLRGLAG